MSLARRLHRLLGWCLILPFFVWSLTGLIFFIKPGYQAAFSSLAVKTYALTDAITISPRPEWQEIKLLRTVLGPHLLVKQAGQWQQLWLHDLSPRPQPGQHQLMMLLQDAIQTDPNRYGSTITATEQGFVTDSGVQIQLDWASLSLSQQGQDTELINSLYKAHYLQWTGHTALDQLLGVIGLLLLMLTTAVGVRLLWRAR